MSKLVVLKFDDGSEWEGKIPDQVERYMAGMADEIQRLRAKQTEIERLRAALKTLVDESERVALSERKEWRPLVHLERAIEQAKTALDAAGG